MLLSGAGSQQVRIKLSSTVNLLFHPLILRSEAVLDVLFQNCKMSVYRLRWSIECTFSSMKTRGFDLERSAMTFADRLERLFGLVTLAWVCCLRVGVWRNALHPIPVKAHGRRAISMVSYGWEYLAQAIRWEGMLAETYFGLLRHPFPAPGAA